MRNPEMPELPPLIDPDCRCPSDPDVPATIVIMSEQPVTAEGATPSVLPASPSSGSNDLRERLTETATRWALMYPLASWPWPGRNLAGADVERLDAIARNIAAEWGADIADRVLAEVSPAVAVWAGGCVECGDPIGYGSRITWRLRWAPQGPVHQECR